MHCESKTVPFLSRVITLTRDIDIAILSVCPSVRNTLQWYCIKTAEHIVMLSSPHDSPFILVSCVYKIFAKSLILRGHF